jgi:hypothetical protein
MLAFGDSEGPFHTGSATVVLAVLSEGLRDIERSDTLNCFHLAQY